MIDSQKYPHLECNFICAGSWNTNLWELPNGLLWVAIPKCGSMTIRKTNGYAGRKVGNVHQRCPGAYERDDVLKYKEGFVVLREPLDRFKSLIAWYFINRCDRGLKIKYSMAGLNWLRKLNLSDNPDGIVENVLRNFEKLQSITGPEHWNTQKSFIPPAFYELENPHFYDMAWLRKNYAIITNTGPSSLVKISEEQREVILKIYEEDVELYNTHTIEPTLTVTSDHPV